MFELRLKDDEFVKRGKKCIPTRGSNMYKGPEEGEKTECSRTGKRSACLGEDVKVLVE